MRYICLAAVIMLGDQLFKTQIVRMLQPGAEKILIPGVISLKQVHNYGAAFSLFQDMRWILLALTAVVCAALLIYLLAGQRRSWLLDLSLAMILGGAAGNALDRLIDGYVVDMFNTLFMNFPVFNIADCFLTVGGILLCLHFITDEIKSRKKAPSPANNAAEEHDADDHGNR